MPSWRTLTSAECSARSGRPAGVERGPDGSGAGAMTSRPVTGRKERGARLAAGDLRGLYLGWLLCAQAGQLVGVTFRTGAGLARIELEVAIRNLLEYTPA